MSIKLKPWKTASLALFIFVAPLAGAPKAAATQLSGGWQLKAAPFSGASETFCDELADAGGAAFALEGGAYKNCPEASPFQPGAAYWLLPGDQETSPSAEAAESVASVSIDLEAGWNLIGNPFGSRLQWERDAKLDGVAPSQASASLPLSFDSETNSYKKSSTLEPGEGYFLFLKTAAVLRLEKTAIDAETLTFASLCNFQSEEDPQSGESIIADQVLISASEGATLEEVQSALEAQGGYLIGFNPELNIYQAQIPAGASAADFAETLKKANPRLGASTHPIFKVSQTLPNDPVFSSPNGDQYWGLGKIKALEAWEIHVAQTDAYIAVLDTGVDAGRPDLEGVALAGANFVDETAPEDTTDALGHGTAVASIIAAKAGNGTGMAGVCQSCKILPVKVCNDSGECPLFAILNGLTWASENGASAANISLSAKFAKNSNTKSVFVKSMAKAKILAITAAGNDGDNADLYLPGSSSQAFNVGATDQNDQKAAFSNSGKSVAVSAPGLDIYTAATGGGFQTTFGTSLSAAYVSGVAGLILSAYPEVSEKQAGNVIRDSADDVIGDRDMGSGRLNAYEALLQARFVKSPLSSVRIVPSTDSIYPSGTVSLIAQTNLDSNTGVIFAWSASNGSLLSASGASVEWTAPQSEGETTIAVAAVDARGNAVSDSIVIAVAHQTPVLTSIAVTPNPIAVDLNGTQQFAAAGFDQYGAPFTEISPLWSATGGIGTINEQGLFSATAVATGTVQAAVGDIAGVADVSVVDGSVDPSAGSTYLSQAGWTNADQKWTTSLDFGDYDGDDDLDVAYSNRTGSISAELWANDGTGNFGAAAVWTSAPSDTGDAREVRWGDYDNDGDLDLAVAIFGPPTRVSIYRNTGGALSSPPVMLPGPSNGSSVVAIDWADYDLDGDIDLAMGNDNPSAGTLDPQNQIRSNNGDGTFATGYIFNIPTLNNVSTDAVAFGDYDADAYPDLVIAITDTSPRNSYIYHNDHSGGFTLAYTANGQRSSDAEWGDYDADGDLDVMFGRGDNGTSEKSQIIAYNSVADSFAVAQTALNAEKTYGVDWGDVDNDGDLDVAVANRVNIRNRIFINTGATLINAINTDWQPTDTERTWDAALADADGDGDLDFGIANLYTTTLVPNSTAGNRVYENTFNPGNASPAVPTINAEPDGVAGPIDLTWNAAADAQTSDADLVTYDLRVGTSTGGCEIFCGTYPNTGRGNWFGNVSNGLTHTLVLSEGTYFWSARAVDSAYGRSAFSAEDSFILRSIYESNLTVGSTQNFYNVEFGDYDLDGDLDLAVANYGGGNRVYEYDGAAPNDYALAWTEGNSDQTQDVDWGDYDNDGYLDLAFANGSSSGQVNRVFRNPGDGTANFSAAWNSGAVLEKSTSVDWGDLDMDGDMDLAFSNDASTANRVYRNDGSNTFTSVWTSSTSYSTKDLEWGDADEDGDLDIADASNGSANVVFLNNGAFINEGSGNFSAGWSSTETDNSYGIAWGDENADGDLDLLVANRGQANRIYASNGSGTTYTLLWSSTETDNNTDGQWADYDNDGDLDSLFAAEAQNVGYRSDGVGIKKKVWTTPENENTRAYDFGDYNGNGDLDLAAANYNSGHGYRVYLNKVVPATTDPTAPSPTAEPDILATSAKETITLAWTAGSDSETTDADILTYDLRVGTTSGGCEIFCGLFPNDGSNTPKANGFGNADSVTSYDILLAPGTYYWSVRTVDSSFRRSSWPAEDSFTITAPFELTSWSPAQTGNFRSPEFADCDGDGDLDISAVRNGAANYVYKNNGTGGFSLFWTSGESDGSIRSDWGDYDNDGDLDLAVANGGGGNERNRVYPNDGSCTLGADAGPAESERSYDVAWGDFDRDGDMDLAVANSSATANRVYGNNGAGALASAWTSSETESSVSVEWGDSDNDGLLDLAVGNTSSTANRVYAGDGAGGLTSAWTSAETENTLDLTFGDYDGDGDLDLAAANDGGQNRVYRNNGSNSFTSVWSDSLASNQSNGADWGDYNGDGIFDLAFANVSGPLLAYRGDGAGAFTLIWASEETLNFTGIQFGDFDGDNDLDLISADNAGAGKPYKYQNNLNPANTQPTAPANPSQPDSTVGEVHLAWSAGSDAETTDADLLQYDVRLGTTSGGCEVFCGTIPNAGMATDYGNVGATSGLSINLLTPTTYYWSVRTVDATFERSAWTTEDSFNLSSCPSVTVATDSGQGSLRECIGMANGNPGTTITFDASIANSSITLASALPAITGAGTTIDGVTGSPNITVDGNNQNFSCITIQSANSVIMGLNIVKCGSAGTDAAIHIAGASATGASIRQNYIGTNSSSTDNIGNYYGIVIDAGAVGNNIGAATLGNVIAGNSKSGILIDASDNTTILGNRIGTDNADAATLPNVESGIVIQNGSTGNVVGGSGANEGNVISNNAVAGIVIDGSGTDNNRAFGNLLGTNAPGSAALANDVGVLISGGASSNYIGGGGAGEKNTISGNTTTGVEIDASAGNFVMGNHIGADTAGSAQVANGTQGVLLHGGATGNTIGGDSSASEGNVISGNTGDGILITGAGTDGNFVLGNTIGLKVDQTNANNNSSDGVAIVAGAASNVIGRPGTGEGNVISLNSQNGILIDASNNNIVQSNFIGLDGTGAIAAGNGGAGIAIQSGSDGTIVGGAGAGEENYISQNDNGIVIDASTNTNIKGNLIGLDVTSANQGNTFDGISIQNGSTDNVVGGTGAEDGNEIAYNGDDGISVVNNASDRNALTRNSMHQNGDLGIDLGLNNVTANNDDSTDTGPNEGRNFPVIVTAEINAANDATMSGTLSTVNPNLSTVSIYKADVSAATNGEGLTWLADATPDAAGAWSVAFNTTDISAGDYVTATQTDGNGNTSEFALNVVVLFDACPVVSSLADDGSTGTLRDCLQKAINAGGSKTITFSVAGTITLGSVLPNIGVDAIEINGGGNIRLDGANAGIDGITISGADNVINDLMITRFSGGGATAITMNGAGATNNTVKNCLIGTDGSIALGNSVGIQIENGASANLIGIAGEGNVISGNGAGVSMDSSTGNIIRNNLIGLDSAGTAAIANDEGITMHNSADGNTIGGDFSAGVGNYISGNTSNGIAIDDSDSNIVQGNRIGVDSAGAAAANGVGIALSNGADSTQIGGDASANLNNFISGNTTGISVDASNNNIVEGCKIGTNVAGTAALANAAGIVIQGGSTGNQIGTNSTTFKANLISGNTNVGVAIDGSNSNSIKGNKIGTNQAGSGAVANGIGIYLSNGAASNVIGASTAGEGNLISGNTTAGILDDGASGTTVQSNKIGTDLAGSASVPNGIGVWITNSSSGAVIGGDKTANKGNTISGNTAAGVQIDGGASGVAVQGNYIGVDSASAANPNGTAGVLIDSGANGNTIGGTAGGRENVIAKNLGSGVQATGGPTTINNAILRNSFQDNSVLGIDLNGVSNNVDANDAGDGDSGANTLLNYPVIDKAEILAGATTVSGSIDAGLANHSVIRVSIYVSTNAGTNGQGVTWLKDVTPSADAAGAWSTTIGGLSAGQYLTATATDNNGAGNTSEFSENVEILADTCPLVTVANDSGTGTLRDCVEKANANVGADAITFDSSLSGATITLASALTMTDSSTSITATNTIIIDGGAAGGFNGFEITGGGNTLDGLTIARFTGGGSDAAVQISGAGATANIVKNCFIGTNSAAAGGLGNDVGVRIQAGASSASIGLAAEPNVISGNNNGDGLGVLIDAANTNNILGNFIGTDSSGSASLPNAVGIAIQNGASNNIIGGSGAGENNVISGNVQEGIIIDGSSSNAIRNNSIGADQAGTAAIANGASGILLRNGADSNLIGGDSSASEGNTISGNTIDGILVDASSNVNILGNAIGVDATRSDPLGNGGHGINIVNGSLSTIIGGGAAGEGNTVSSNGDDGIFIATGCDNASLLANNIGADQAGTVDLGNAGDGIQVDADGVTIGGTGSGEFNVISGNNGAGINLTGNSAAIIANFIGTDGAGSGAMGNDSHGIFIDGGANNTIGGSGAGEANTIAYNFGDGIFVTGAAADGNDFIQNSYHDNSGLGIDLNQDGDGPDNNTAGDADTGPNEGQNFPVIASSLLNGLTNITTVEGTLDSIAPLTAYTIEVYLADSASAVNGEGETFKGSTTPDAAGDWTVDLTGLNNGEFVTAIARDASGNTSEFALNSLITASTSCPLVTSTADSGFGSLRECISIGNLVPGSVITFSSSMGLPATINLQSALPSITADGTSIYATGAVTIDGSFGGGGFNGMTIESDDNVIDGLGFINFAGSGSNAALTITNGATNNTITNCAIGTDFSDSAGVGNDIGVRINGGAFGNLIGGDNNPTTIRNIISGNSVYGILITGAGSDSNDVQGNYIGTDSTGTAALANAEGVRIEGQATNNLIGSTTDTGSAKNTISGNTGNGIVISGVGTIGNMIGGNKIGLNEVASFAVPNGGVGVKIQNGATGNQIGNDGWTTISGNGSHGIEISGANQNTVRSNVIGVDDSEAPLPNGGDGININGGSTLNFVGGTVYEQGNLISGNTGAGIRIDNASSNTIRTFYIGVDQTGTTAIGNGGAGIVIDNNSDNNVIGISTFTSITANNGGAGIAIVDLNSTGNRIQRVVSYGNDGGGDGRGIDLFDDGVTANDPPTDADAGPNNLFDFPVLDPVSYNFTTGVSKITGKLTVPSPSGKTIELFRARPASGQNGQADLWLGTTTAAADGSFSFSTNTLSLNDWVTATARDSSGNTSEFALNEEIRIGSTPTITSVVSNCPDVIITWDPSDHPAYNAYTLLKTTTSGSGYATVATGLTTTTYTESLVSNNTYYYVVRAYKSDEPSNATNLSAEYTHIQNCPIFVCQTFGEYEIYFFNPGADLEPQALYHPLDAVFDGNGDIWVTSNQHYKLKIYDADGNIQPYSPVGSFGSGTGQFNNPAGLDYDAGKIYVADTSNNRIQVVDANSRTFVDKWLTTGSPVDIAADGAGNFYVTTSQGYIRKYNSAHAEVTGGNWPIVINQPKSITYQDSAGLLWVAGYGTNKIYRYDTSGALVGSFGTTGTGPGQLKGPWGLAIDESIGVVYVVDRNNHRMNSYLLADDSFDKTWGGYGSVNNEEFNYPAGLTIDSTTGDVYVMDDGNWKVQRFCN